MKINMLKEKIVNLYWNGEFEKEEVDVNVYNFGGIAFIKQNIIVPTNNLSTEPITIEYAEFCTSENSLKYQKYECFQNEFDNTNYIHYNYTNDYANMDIYINKDMLLTTLYIGNGYEFIFKHNDGWWLECKEDDIVEINGGE